MSDRTEQRIWLRFCFCLGKTATETHRMLQKVFKEEALNRTQVFEWFARFKRGEMSIEYHPHSWHPSTSRTDENVEKIREQINEDRRYTIDEISEATFLSWSSCQRIWTSDALPRSSFPPAHTGPKKKSLVWLCARSWKIRLKVTQTFFLRSSQATKVGAMGTTLRPNKLRANGRRQPHRDRKSQPSEVKCENDANCFFPQCWRNRASGIRSSWTDR